MPRIRANDLSIHYDLAGPDAAPVVMLSNSLGTRLEMWDPQMAALSREYRVLRYDSRGHGRSDAPAGSYTIEQLAADALGLLDVLQVEQVHFCGLSMGGMVGQVLGARHGDRLASLTLCATMCRVPAPEMWDERISIATTEGMAALVDAVTERWFTAAFIERAPEAVGPIREMILATSPAGYGGCCAAIRDMDLCEAAANIRAPTLVVAGADDPATTPEVMQALAGRIDGARFVELADAAHLLNIQQSEKFNRLLLDFLAADG